jgi:hypothetical protein
VTLQADVADTIRRTLSKDVDLKVEQKLEELWQRGRQMLTQVQQRQQDRNDKLASEISACQERCRAMEAENEQLKQVLTSLGRRLALLGPAFGGASVPGCTGSPGGGGSATTATGGGAGGGSSLTTPSPAAARNGHSSDIFTPGQAAASSCEGAFVPLPEVPAFPFPAQTPLQTPLQAQGALLKLAEALGAQSPQQPPTQPTPLSLASSIPSLPREEPQPLQHIFSFTLRKADDTDLGLNVSTIPDEQVLLVESVRPEGAVDAWNRQCLGGAFPERAVCVGDKILSVNNVSYEPDKMLEECKDKFLLRLTICRGELPVTAGGASMADAAAVPEATSPVRLRAEASEFVPMSAVGATSSPAAPAVPADAPAAAGEAAPAGSA